MHVSRLHTHGKQGWAAATYGATKTERQIISVDVVHLCAATAGGGHA